MWDAIFLTFILTCLALLGAYAYTQNMFETASSSAPQQTEEEPAVPRGRGNAPTRSSILESEEMHQGQKERKFEYLSMMDSMEFAAARGSILCNTATSDSIKKVFDSVSRQQVEDTQVSADVA